MDGPDCRLLLAASRRGSGSRRHLVDGIADAHDVSATIIDLAVRGWFTIAEVATADSTDRDWVLHRSHERPSDRPNAFELDLVESLFADGDHVQLSTLKGRFGMSMREAQIGLYREVVDRGRYRRHPRAKNARVRLLGLTVLVPVALIALYLVLDAGLTDGDWSYVPLFLGAALAVVVLARWGRRRTPRTALGTAVRIEALGFREYLATAEADQLRFEELRTIVSRYLPYAVAFGLTGHWASLFASLVSDPRWAEHVATVADAGLDFAWYSGSGDTGLLGDGLGDIGDIGDLGGIGDLAALPDADGLLDGLDGFTDATDGLFDIGGLLDGCDGCGCDPF